MTRGLEGRSLGGFELQGVLGEGAFATVYRARQVRLGRDVAVKVLDRELARDPNAARRFEREGRSAASLDHPSIVPVYEAGEEEGVVYLAMRLVDGDTLAGRLEEGPLEPDELLRIVEAVTTALDHAHARGIIHRDVKPSNILLEDSRVYLADFGIAATAREVGRYTAGAIGTAAYMAPEQARSTDLDHRADLYSLGCVVFECLTGAPPFFRADMIELLMAHASEPVPEMGVPGLDRFFARALAKDPADRFASGGEFLAGLRGVLAAEPDTIRDAATPPGEPPPPRTTEPDRPPARRRWWIPVAFGGVAVVGLVVAFGLVRGDTGEPETESTVIAGGTASFGIQSDLDTLNPHVDLAVEPLISGPVLPPLFLIDEDGTPTPHLAAELPTIESEDPQVVSWRLRDDAVWDDGSPITARDVERTYRYVVDPASNTTGIVLYERIGSLEVTGERTFRVTFTEPVAPTWLLFSTIHPVIKADALDGYLAEGGDPGAFLQTDVSFSGGPYRVAGFSAGESIRLTPNERWWGDPPNLERIEGRAFTSVDDLVDALRTGDVDIVYLGQPRPTTVEALRNAGDAVTVVGEGSVGVGVLFNHRTGPTADPIIRRAVSLALDRRAIGDATAGRVTGEAVDPLESLVYLPHQAQYEPHFTAYDHDPDAAGDLLTDGGWLPGPDGIRVKDGTRLIIDYRFPSDSPGDDQTAVALQIIEQLRRVGIEVIGTPLTFPDLVAAHERGDFEMATVVWLFNIDPAISVLKYATDRCPATVPGCTAETGINFGGYASDPVTDLLTASDAEFEPDRRAALLNQADEAMAGDLPALPLYVIPEVVAYDERLGNIEPRPLRGGPLSGLVEWGFLSR